MKKSVLLVFTFLLAPACGKEESTPPPPPAVTYWQDIAPIYYENCVECHQPGGIAPFRLDRFEDAKAWAPAAKAAVTARTMPPWLTTGDGSCGEFRDSRWLDAETIEKIVAWVDDAAPEGSPRSDLEVPHRPGLDGDLIVQTPQYAPEIQGGPLAEFDDYRCFLIDPALAADRFITGYEVIPGEPAIAHHVLMMPIDPDAVVGPNVTNRDVIRALDEQSPDRDGWPCFGLAGDGVAVDGVPVTWAPGMGVVEYPVESGVYLPQNRLFVVQMHYNLADPSLRGKSDSTRIELRTASQVERFGFFTLPDLFLNTLFTGEPAELPPGRESVEYTWSTSFDEQLAMLQLPYVEVYGVFPHMHERGRKLKAEIGTAENMSCAAEVQRWNFGWQYFYFYEQPYRISPGTELRVTCDFDTRGRTEPVLPGWGTQNEMCLAGLYVVLPSSDAP